MGAGLSVGLSGLAAGFAVGIVGDAGVRGTAQQPRFVLFFVLLRALALVLFSHDKDKKTMFCSNKSLYLLCFPFRLYVGMILILIFAEVLGLYGLIVALIMTTKNQPGC